VKSFRQPGIIRFAKSLDVKKSDGALKKKCLDGEMTFGRG
jgi:hypothetical protein